MRVELLQKEGKERGGLFLRMQANRQRECIRYGLLLPNYVIIEKLPSHVHSIENTFSISCTRYLY